jgi:hypothetical protein
MQRYSSPDVRPVELRWGMSRPTLALCVLFLFGRADGRESAAQTLGHGVI